MEALTFVALGALAVKFTDFLKYLAARDVNAVVTQATVWIGGLAAMFLAAQSEAAENIVVWGNQPIGNLDGWSLVLAGLGLGSVGSFGYDVKKAVDGTDSAATPKLLRRRGTSTT